MSLTSARPTAKKAPKQQRPIECKITIERKTSDEIVAILAENSAVDELRFEFCFNKIASPKITSPVISAIFELKHLRSLHLYRNNIDAAGAEKIAKNLVGSNLQSLNLYGNMIGDAGATEIANHLVGSNLTNLNLAMNQ